MKIYILLVALLFASCTSTDTQKETRPKPVAKSKLAQQEEEFKKLEAENQTLKSEIEELDRKIDRLEEYNNQNKGDSNEK
jgi:uncharacterized protein YlxW (UPF0749 family)